MHHYTRNHRNKKRHTRKIRGGGLFDWVGTLFRKKDQETTNATTQQPQQQQQQQQQRSNTFGWFKKDPFAKEKKDLLSSIKFYTRETGDTGYGGWYLQRGKRNPNQEIGQQEIKTGQLYVDSFKRYLDASNIKYNALSKPEEERKIDYEEAEKLMREGNQLWAEYVVNRRLLSDMYNKEENERKKSTPNNALQSFGRMGFGGSKYRNKNVSKKNRKSRKSR
jgi:hypothetical protein